MAPSVLAATMNSSSQLVCRLVDVLGMVVTMYTHMINNVIDMGHKYVIAEKDNTLSCFLGKSEDECSSTVDKHLTFLIHT